MNIWQEAFRKALLHDDPRTAAQHADETLARASRFTDMLMDHAADERRRDEYNLDLCAEAAARYRSGGYDLVKIECFNQAEADKVAAVMARLYPGVPCVCTFRFPPAKAVAPSGENPS